MPGRVACRRRALAHADDHRATLAGQRPRQANTPDFRQLALGGVESFLDGKTERIGTFRGTERLALHHGGVDGVAGNEFGAVLIHPAATRCSAVRFPAALPERPALWHGSHGAALRPSKTLAQTRGSSRESAR